MLAGVYVPSSYMRVLYSCIILYLFASKFGFFFKLSDRTFFILFSFLKDF